MRLELVQNALGRTKVKVTELGFGGATLGNLYNEISDAEASSTLQEALKSGINFLDTAPHYGAGLSEVRFGKVLQHIDKADYILSTKVGRVLKHDPNADVSKLRNGFLTPMPFTAEYDYSYDGIMHSYEDSLKRMGLVKIDVLLVHDIGVVTHGDDNDHYFKDLTDSGYSALDELKRNGDVGAIGLGVNEWEACEQAMDIGQFDCFLLAGRYTLLEQEPLKHFLPRCLEYGASLIVGGAYNSGILAVGTRSGQAMNYNYQAAPDQIIKAVQKIEDICDQFNVTLAAAALQFPLAHDAVATVVPGLSNPEQFAQTLKLYHEKIPAEFWQTLKDKGLLSENAPVPKEKP
ncbi:MAG: aldo/keto reductase [Kordiimonadaceae bacterium]|nr:aldo/keto reductase [Kordiimonadaceae bacterium]